ncbi:MAG: glycosyl transferase [Chloroflexi bacterium]|nr:MAG: glycosyl transferase [Chloroflexota bacterium]
MTSGDLPGGRVALVHDWLNQRGGAENVLEELVALFPGAPLYTSIYAAERMPDAYRRWPIHTSWMQRLPGVAAYHQRYLPLYPLAFGGMDLSGYDLVISNKSGFCHGVQTAARTRRALHICYCLTPTRFLWLYDQYRAREQIGGALDAALRPLLALLRRWDWAAAQRVDHFVAISRTVQDRIRHIYGRDSTIIYPPVDTEYFTPAPMRQGGDHYLGDYYLGDYYLIVSRLIPYKRIDLAVAAFAHLPGEKLLVVGEGRDLAALRAVAGPNVHFLGWQTRARIRELMQGCKAFLFPGLEDFGITPVEAMAAGRPVVAFAGGGALDTVLPGVTGEHFAEQSAVCLAESLARFDAAAYDPAACRAQAERFSAAAFRTALTGYVRQVLSAAPVALTSVISEPVR